MCTITYLPHHNGYILTQNRDESPLRADAVFPVREKRAGHELIYPQDPEGSGSWFVSAENGMTICVMNGAYHPNKKPGDYKHSRGLVPLHFLELGTDQAFLQDYHYRELEAFTLLVCSPDGVTEFIWNEKTMQVNNHPVKHLIFQSAPLYDAQQQAFRINLFKQFVANHQPEHILDFHTKPQTADPTIDIRMDRQRVKSVSTVQRKYGTESNQVTYLPLGASEPQTERF